MDVCKCGWALAQAYNPASDAVLAGAESGGKKKKAKQKVEDDADAVAMKREPEGAEEPGEETPKPKKKKKKGAAEEETPKTNGEVDGDAEKSTKKKKKIKEEAADGGGTSGTKEKVTDVRTLTSRCVPLPLLVGTCLPAGRHSPACSMCWKALLAAPPGPVVSQWGPFGGALSVYPQISPVTVLTNQPCVCSQGCRMHVGGSLEGLQLLSGLFGGGVV